MTEVKKDNLFNCFNQGYEKDVERAKFIEENISNKNEKEIMKYLLELEPDEIGGITAISGFYYQFLVTIEYCIELLDGKWDFVAFELHDDIIVGNEEEKIIRFVQVKTSKKLLQNPSDVSNLYLRTTKKDDKTKEKYNKNDSWIDKLVSKAQYFKTLDGYNTQFQLYTSYHIIKSNQYNFDHYTDNINFNKPIPTGDSLLEKLSNECYDSNCQKVTYDELCGESLNELLSRLYIKTGHSLVDIEKYKNHLIIELSKRIFRDFKTDNITLTNEDIHFLVGFLSSRCFVNKDKGFLKLTKEDLEEILVQLRENCLAKVDKTLEKHGSKRIVEELFDAYLEDLNQSSLPAAMIDKIYTYKSYLLNWIEDGGHIRDLFNRYVEGTFNVQAYFKTNSSNRQAKLKDFISMIIILNTIHNETLEFTPNKFLITKVSKKIGNKNLISLLNLISRFNVEIAKQKIDFIMGNIDEKEHLFLLDKELKIILQGYTDRKFINQIKYEIKPNKSINDIEKLPSSSDITKVSLTSTIIPGNIMNEEADELLLSGDFANFSDKLNKLWCELGE
ncbi:dsDNA nuclease domain-containing protein [Priestia megaterium]|uniref:dsDNA nuclease domain-containing protein n=1 Tax=Priestia megaterium TaxID=1404 RepID=UPI00372D47B1